MIKGDLVLCATDGLYDNLFDSDIVKIMGDASLTLEEKSITLARTAFTCSLNPNYYSPFSEREREWLLKQAGNNRLMKRRGPGAMLGGKSDDISVVLAVIE